MFLVSLDGYTKWIKFKCVFCIWYQRNPRQSLGRFGGRTSLGGRNLMLWHWLWQRGQVAETERGQEEEPELSAPGKCQVPHNPAVSCPLSQWLSYLAGGMEDRSSILNFYIKHLKLRIYLRLGSHQMCAKPSGCSPLLFWKHEDFSGPSFIFLFLTGHEYQKMFFFHKKR